MPRYPIGFIPNVENPVSIKNTKNIIKNSNPYNVDIDSMLKLAEIKGFTDAMSITDDLENYDELFQVKDPIEYKLPDPDPIIQEIYDKHVELSEVNEVVKEVVNEVVNTVEKPLPIEEKPLPVEEKKSSKGIPMEKSKTKKKVKKTKEKVDFLEKNKQNIAKIPKKKIKNGA